MDVSKLLYHTMRLNNEEFKILEFFKIQDVRVARLARCQDFKISGVSRFEEKDVKIARFQRFQDFKI